MRTRFCVIGAGLLLLTACEAQAGAIPAGPAPVVADVPASAAGGACHLLDYDVIEQATGARFDVAVATRREQTYTCLVRARAASRPDLVLSATETSADVEIFTEDVVPRGAKPVKGLGKAGYRLAVPAASGQGPGVEVGWLSGNGRLLTLRYTLGTGQDAAAELSTRLVTLAQRVDAAAV
ncbi:hypothetical protein SAMN05444365_102392 [Micromonospora pattaloongensis]|uniref:DUF2020 domain-containing protein n=1 Tax=Micromonospora pattaloongensis TaxID=405436 RepID=A0A1H3K8E1_9ACTN|nr:hypothetical protein [Micromonospora pattaloongensis]SDY48055.1 hypothetical protein SAMN05444365_102392 [Micromonospora pattaloongensis]